MNVLALMDMGTEPIYDDQAKDDIGDEFEFNPVIPRMGNTMPPIEASAANGSGAAPAGDLIRTLMNTGDQYIAQNYPAHAAKDNTWLYILGAIALFLFLKR